MVARLSLLQLFLAFAVATARNDPPPSSERAWAPPNLPNYTYPEIVSAQRNLASARSVSHDTQSAIFTAATALALSTRDLARPTVRPLRPSAVRSLNR